MNKIWRIRYDLAVIIITKKSSQVMSKEKSDDVNKLRFHRHPTMKKYWSLNLAKFLFLVCVFCSACSSPSHKNMSRNGLEEDQKWIDKFFQEFFFETASIYTLFGTKPMSEVLLVSATEQERLESFLPYLNTLDIKDRNEFIQELKKSSQSYDLDKNWDKWVKWKKQRGPSPFLFVKRPIDDHLSSGYIINAQEVVWILRKHYDLFCRELGLEFDPLNAILDFENLQSVFWNKVFDSHLLQGILHGYGERNSYFFSEQMKLQKEDPHQFDRYCIFRGPSPKEKKEPLPLPMFRSYTTSGSDPVLVQYKEERRKIQQELKGKDFTQVVFSRLFPAEER